MTTKRAFLIIFSKTDPSQSFHYLSCVTLCRHLSNSQSMWEERERSGKQRGSGRKSGGAERSVKREGISSRAERAENFLTATMLKVHPCGSLYVCGPLHLHGPFTCMGPFRFRVALLHLYRAFYYHMDRPTPQCGAVRAGFKQLSFCS